MRSYLRRKVGEYESHLSQVEGLAEGKREKNASQANVVRPRVSGVCHQDLLPSGSLLGGLSSHNGNMEGDRDAEGWKLKEIDDPPLIPARSLTSLDAT